MNYIITRKPERNLLSWGFDSFLDDLFIDSPVTYRNSPATGEYYPKVDVREAKESFVIEAELPGLTEKDIDVKVEDNLITISSKKRTLTTAKSDATVEKSDVTAEKSDVTAEKDDVVSAKSDDTKQKKEGYIIRERRSSAFSRSFTLPDNVDKDNIAAHYTNGLLTLSISKTKEAPPKEIEIKTN